MARDPDCWVRAYKGGRRLQPISSYADLILTPDVRFPNEVACIQDLGGHVIRQGPRLFPERKRGAISDSAYGGGERQG